MNTEMQLLTVTHNSAETERFAAQLAANLLGGETIELASDLGGGKTTFARGLLVGLGSNDHVSSPTFTVSKEYKAGTFRILHYDFYRMSDPGHVADMLAEEVLDDKTICIIEWAGSVAEVLPKDRLLITIAKDATNESTRTITLTYTSRTAYSVKGLL